jgi:hypothetical protein
MKHARSKPGHPVLAAELASLPTLSSERLKERWRTLYSTEPPPRISRDLLTRAVAYQLQVRAFGGLSSSTRRLLERVAAHGQGRKSNTATAQTRKLRPGAVLIREWRGVSHQVTVLDDGVLFNGERYGSLSEVARKITGSHWSGPLFFGLRSAAQENHDGAR